jgi:hypothetical protein
VGLLISADAVLGTNGQDHHHRHHVPLARFDRRGMLLSTGAAIAGAALAGPGVVHAADDKEDQFRPLPLPLPKPIPGGFAPGAHVFAPGPTDITLPFSYLQLMGLDVEPTVITDYSGFTALAYPVGTVHGSDGKQYNLEGDIRVFSGMYVPAGAKCRSCGAPGFEKLADGREPFVGTELRRGAGNVVQGRTSAPEVHVVFAALTFAQEHESRTS